jgi:membrane dipeptidase
MYDVSLVVDFAKKNASMYNDGGYMIDAFNKGADDAAMMARILPAITDDLWERGYTNEQLAKIYAGNKMRVYQRVWEMVKEQRVAIDTKHEGSLPAYQLRKVEMVSS